MKDKSKGYRIFSICNYILLSMIALACLYPFYYVVAASFSNPEALMRHQGLLLFPLQEMTLDGYDMVFNNELVLSGFANTFFVLVVGLIFNMVLTVIGAYVLSLKDLMLRRPLTLFIIVTMYFSGGLIPFYFLIKDLGLLDTFWVYII